MYSKISDLFDKIVLWKKRYPNVFSLSIGDNLYIFRILTRGEYLDIMSLRETFPEKISGHILNKCLLYPSYLEHDFDNRLAGEIHYLEECIGSLSGFSKTDEFKKDLDEARGKINVLDNQIILLICKAFPQLTLEYINNLDYNTLLRYLVLSEAILETDLSIEKLDTDDTVNFDEDNKNLGGERFGPPLKKP